MNISLTQENDMIIQKNNSLLSQIIGSNIASVKRINDGRNSSVYTLTCENSKKYVVKFYFPNPSDKKDRMNKEFSSLKFLWEHSIRSIPQPIAIEKEHQFAIYDHIEGTKILFQEINAKDIDYACEFLKKLYRLKTREESNQLPFASEACFSVREIVENIEERYKRLTALPREDKQNNALFEFLEKEFNPSLSTTVTWCKDELTKQGIYYSSKLEKENRTLSPSDFGFHNAIRQKDGSIVFLDFEHFGWDDPAKMISDFLIHPDMDPQPNLKKLFVRNMVSYFVEDKNLKTRLKVVFPLFGLKWCLIFLNEFLPEDFQRREFAHNKELVKEKVQAQQLLKAKNFLNQVMKNFKNFPYGA